MLEKEYETSTIVGIPAAQSAPETDGEEPVVLDPDEELDKEVEEGAGSPDGDVSEDGGTK